MIRLLLSLGLVVATCFAVAGCASQSASRNPSDAELAHRDSAERPTSAKPSIAALEKRGDVSGLIDEARAEESPRQRAAIHALGRMSSNPTVLQALLHLLQESPRKTREEVATALADAGVSRAVPAIVVGLAKDAPQPSEPGELSFSSFFGNETFELGSVLRKLGPDAVAPLTDAMKASSSVEQGQFALALGMMGKMAKPSIPDIIELYPTSPERTVGIYLSEKEWAGEQAATSKYGPGSVAVNRISRSVNGEEPIILTTYIWKVKAPAAAAALYEITGEYRGPNREDWVE